MNCAQICILEKGDKVCFRSLLQCTNRWALYAKVWLELVHNLLHKALERKLAYQQISRPLIAANLGQSHIARLESLCSFPFSSAIFTFLQSRSPTSWLLAYKQSPRYRVIGMEDYILWSVTDLEFYEVARHHFALFCLQVLSLHWYVVRMRSDWPVWLL